MRPRCRLFDFCRPLGLAGIREKTWHRICAIRALIYQHGVASESRPVVSLASRAGMSDLARWIDGPVGSVAILANGYDCGFSTCWPKGSRLFLDQFEAAWLAPDGNIDEAALRACGEFCSSGTKALSNLGGG